MAIVEYSEGLLLKKLGITQLFFFFHLGCRNISVVCTMFGYKTWKCIGRLLFLLVQVFAVFCDR